MHGLLHLGVGTGGGAPASWLVEVRARWIPIQAQPIDEFALGGFTSTHEGLVRHVDHSQGLGLEPVLAQPSLGLQRAANVIGFTRPREASGGKILHKARQPTGDRIALAYQRGGPGEKLSQQANSGQVGEVFVHPFLDVGRQLTQR